MGMKHIEPQMTFLTFLLGLTVQLAACDPDWAKRLDTGTLYPNFRFTVKLSEPQDRRALHLRLEELATQTGFSDYRGREITDEFLYNLSGGGKFSFRPPEAAADQYRLSLSWAPYDMEKPTEVLVIVGNNMGMADFTAEQWIYFRHWRDEILPAALPDGVITVTTHPARFTGFEMLEYISEETGMPIPEKYLKHSEGE